jgi:hypothetical protein
LSIIITFDFVIINYRGSCCKTLSIIITFDFVIHATSTVIIDYYRGSVYCGKCH